MSPAGGRYVLGDLLGRGGMAEVFAGHALGSLGFQKPVAIKRLLPERARDEEFVARLVGEAKLLVGLQHTNVISVLDLVRDGDDVFLVMEFVDGPSLRQLINVRRMRTGGPVSLGLAAYIVQAACAGLEYAHARPSGAIIHADVSPSNVLLTTAGEVKVADFGIARREGIAAAVEGKWAYMPPEQARGEALTPRSDEFALGVVLYELITGVHPFARRVTENGREAGAVENVRPPRAIRPEIPLHLEAACLRAMAPEPGDRYARLQQLHDALAEIRFACGWREGAPELATAIAESGATAGESTSVDRKPAPARTQVTSNPVTLVTKSLLEGTGPSDAGSKSKSKSKSKPGATVEMPSAVPESSQSELLARAESMTPHAWVSSPAASHRRRWPIAAGLATAALVGAAIAAVIVSRGGDGVDAPVAAAAAAAAPGSAAVAAAATLTVTATDPVAVPVAAAVPSPVTPPPAPVPVAATETVMEGETVAVADEPARTATPVRQSVKAKAKAKAKVDAREDGEGQGQGQGQGEYEDGGMGSVRIYARPWAYVESGGKRLETPVTLTLPAGMHDISLYNPESKIRKTVTVTIRPGKPKTLNVRLAP